MLVVNVPIPESRPRPPLLRREWCIAATIVRFIIVVALCETIETPPLLLPRERKGAVNAASLNLLPPTSDSPPPLLLLPLLLRAATKEEERADDDDATTAREEKAIQFNSSLEREENARVRAFVRSNVLRIKNNGVNCAR